MFFSVWAVRGLELANCHGLYYYALVNLLEQRMRQEVTLKIWFIQAGYGNCIYIICKIQLPHSPIYGFHTPYNGISPGESPDT